MQLIFAFFTIFFPFSFPPSPFSKNRRGQSEDKFTGAESSTGCVSETDLCHYIAVPGKFTNSQRSMATLDIREFVDSCLAVVHREKIEEQPSPEGILSSISSGFVFFVNNAKVLERGEPGIC